MTEKIVKQTDAKPRIGNPRWLAGNSGNPHGRPVKPEAEILRKALEAAKKSHNNTHLIDHAVNLAYTNDNVLIAILKKILPDRVQGEGLSAQTIINIIRPERQKVIE